MGLPEIILRKMLVPHSFRFEHSRLSFEIKNTYASGTITSLKLIADGNAIPLDQIQYQAEGQPAKLASQISPQSPASISTGILISISAQVSANPKILVLWAETKEAGIIQFTVKAENTLAMRKPSILSLTRKPLEFHLDFDLEYSSPIHDLLVGGNWTADPKTNPGKASSIHLPLVVFPPLNSSLGYRWSDGVGPFPTRNAHHDLGWKRQQDDRFGTDEFLQICESNNSQPVLVVDSTLASAEQAAHWVSYCNDSPQRLEGKARSQNGHPTPYSVKTWIISGCAWQDWELTGTSALTYARKINHFVQAMREEDSDLKIGILVKCLASDDPADQTARWNENLLNEVGQNIDFVYWQIPILEDGFINEEIHIENISKVQQTFQAQLEKMITRIQGQISRCIQNRDVRQAIDASQFFDSLDAQIHTNSTRMDQIDCNMLLLDTLKSILKLGNTITFLTLGVNELQTTLVPTMTAFFAALISGAEYWIVPVRISSNSAFDGPHSDGTELDALLLSSPDEHQFKLIMANRSSDQRLRVELTPPQPGKLRVLKSSRTSSILNALIPNFREKGNLREMNLSPHSITFISFEHSAQSS